MSRVGPTLRIAAYCHGCVHKRAKRYDCQSDWGYNYYCDHPTARGMEVPDPTATPSWCPEMASAKTAFFDAEAKP